MGGITSEALEGSVPGLRPPGKGLPSGSRTALSSPDPLAFSLGAGGFFLGLAGRWPGPLAPGATGIIHKGLLGAGAQGHGVLKGLHVGIPEPASGLHGGRGPRRPPPGAQAACILGGGESLGAILLVHRVQSPSWSFRACTELPRSDIRAPWQGPGAFTLSSSQGRKVAGLVTVLVPPAVRQGRSVAGHGWRWGGGLGGTAGWPLRPGTAGAVGQDSSADGYKHRDCDVAPWGAVDSRA